MQNFRIDFTNPWLLLLIVPAILLTLLPYFRMNKKYRRTRNRIISMSLHVTAMVMAIALLAGISFKYELPNEKNEIILLVDSTDSNEASADAKDEFIQTVLNICDGEFKVGIVKFGFDQKYVAELSNDSQETFAKYLTSENPDTTATDLASALKYAATLFSNPETGKIVVISDGIETDKAAMSVIKAIAADGIKVDTVCYPNELKDEMQIVSVNIPEQHIVPEQAFALELAIKNNFEAGGEYPITLSLYDNEELVGSTNVTVNKQEMVIPVSLTFEERGLHELRFEISYNGDTKEQNNAYHTFVHLEILDNILIIERNENESEKLQNMLKDEFNITAISIAEDLAQMPRDIRSMVDYEQIILVNIAYSDMPAGFESLLNQYVYELGGGLFTVGGENDMINGTPVPHAYNRTDINNSVYYKQMLPVNIVDFTPPIAVMIVVDTSASMSMGKLDAAKKGAEACLDALGSDGGDRNFCGVISFESISKEETEILPVSRKDDILESIRKIGADSSASGGTIFSDAIMRAGRSLGVIDNVERKHIILITDGNPGDPYEQYEPYILDNMKDGITMSILTVGDDVLTSPGLREQMEQAATVGGGKFYNAPQNDLSSVPEMIQQDVSMEAVPEIRYGEEFYPKINDITAAVANISQADMPPLTGYYGTMKKTDAVVPLMGEYVPIYAQWKYGAGTVGSFMCDLNGNWSGAFIENEVGKTIIKNIIRDLFPMNDIRYDDIEYSIKTDNYTNQINVYGVLENHKVKIDVTPVSQSLKEKLTAGIKVTEAEDNRRFTYVLKDSGLYQISIKQIDESGNQINEIVTYQTFSYSQEYNEFTDRRPLGEELLTLLAEDGKGVVISDPADVFASFAKTLKREFDPRMILLISVIVLVLLDIAVRKFKFKWPHELVREHRQRKADSAPKEK